MEKQKQEISLDQLLMDVVKAKKASDAAKANYDGIRSQMVKRLDADGLSEHAVPGVGIASVKAKRQVAINDEPALRKALMDAGFYEHLDLAPAAKRETVKMLVESGNLEALITDEILVPDAEKLVESKLPGIAFKYGKPYLELDIEEGGKSK